MSKDSGAQDELVQEPAATEAAEWVLPSSAEVGIHNLPAIIATLDELGAGQYAPARFCSVRALVATACSDPATRSNKLQLKALDSLVNFVEELHLARQQIDLLAAQLLEEYPQAGAELSEAAGTLDIRALQRLQRRLQRGRGPGLLAQLTDDLVGLSSGSGLPLAAEGFSGDLEAQEQEILSEYQHAGVPRTELRSAQRYRQAMLRVGAEQLVAQAQAQSPADSGPLNPQRLATRSLAIMQELSPAYTARFVSYIDTLFYLESLPAD